MSIIKIDCMLSIEIPTAKCITSVTSYIQEEKTVTVNDTHVKLEWNNLDIKLKCFE